MGATVSTPSFAATPQQPVPVGTVVAADLAAAMTARAGLPPTARRLTARGDGGERRAPENGRTFKVLRTPTEEDLDRSRRFLDQLPPPPPRVPGASSAEPKAPKPRRAALAARDAADDYYLDDESAGAGSSGAGGEASRVRMAQRAATAEAWRARAEADEDADLLYQRELDDCVEAQRLAYHAVLEQQTAKFLANHPCCKFLGANVSVLSWCYCNVVSPAGEVTFKYPTKLVCSRSECTLSSMHPSVLNLASTNPNFSGTTPHSNVLTDRRLLTLFQTLTGGVHKVSGEGEGASLVCRGSPDTVGRICTSCFGCVRGTLERRPALERILRTLQVRHSLGLGFSPSRHHSEPTSSPKS